MFLPLSFLTTQLGKHVQLSHPKSGGVRELTVYTLCPPTVDTRPGIM